MYYQDTVIAILRSDIRYQWTIIEKQGRIMDSCEMVKDKAVSLNNDMAKALNDLSKSNSSLKKSLNIYKWVAYVSTGLTVVILAIK